MIRWMLPLMMLTALSAASCGTEGPPEDDAPGSTTSGDGKADIYGDDDRHDLDSPDVTTAQARAAQSTVMLFGSAAIFDIADNGYTLSPRTHAEKKQAEFNMPLCSEERFQDEPAPGFCSGFLIGPDLVATAGHCVGVSTKCQDIKLAFGFHDTDRFVSKDDFYSCKTVVGHLYNRERLRTIQDYASNELWSDWAVLQLDRPVTGRTPLELRSTPVYDGEAIAAIGHPGGIPTKVTTGNVSGDPQLVWYNTDLDIYRGNSGSLIADSAGRAVGIVSRGTGGASYKEDSTRQCMVSKHCDGVGGAGCAGNQGIRVEPLSQFLEATPVKDYFVGGYDVPLPDNGVAKKLDFEIDADGYIHYVTFTAHVMHTVPKTLEFTIVAPDGRRHIALDGPVDLPKGLVTASRTSFAFSESAPRGTWSLEIRDKSPNDTILQNIEWAQLVVGVAGTPPDVPTPPAWIGSACATDADCDFSISGTPGQCFMTGAEGFCSVPCEGYCPDQDGFATTFCADLGMGIGNCATTPALSNSYCADVPGTSRATRDRYVGSSSAPANDREVCAP